MIDALVRRGRDTTVAHTQSKSYVRTQSAGCPPRARTSSPEPAFAGI